MQKIVLDGVTKRFGGQAVLDEISLEIEPGEFCVLLGVSGSGKSTLLNLISGLESVTDGRVLLGGRDMTHALPKDRDVAMVFQNCALYPMMSVRENIGFALRANGVGRAEVAQRVEVAANALKIHALLSRRASDLSGGQRQRVAIARALVRQTSVIALDEPLTGLDFHLRMEIRDELKRVHAITRATMLYVTHDQAEALSLADRIAVLDGGRIVQFAPPTVIYDRPANARVAALVGAPSISLLPGTLCSRRNGQALRLGDSVVELGHSPSKSAEDERVVVAIRPEHCRLVMDDEPGRLHGTVEGVDQHGSDRYARVGVLGHSLRVRLGWDESITVGAPARIALTGDRLSIFDQCGDQRLN